EGTEAGQETEDRRCHAGREREPLALPHPLTPRELVADGERPGTRLIEDLDPRLQLPGAREQLRQVDAGAPGDPGLEGAAVEHATDPGGVGRSREDEFGPLVAVSVDDGKLIASVTSCDSRRRAA